MKNTYVSCVCKMIPLAIYWCTWKERNCRIFADNALSYQNFKIYFLRRLYSWSLVLNNGKNLSFLGFVDNIIHESRRA